ncbi:MAG: SDR family oxidoreductase [Alphaproteobacteria bacterium]
MTYDLNNRVVLVSGAAQGIGRAIAATFKTAGALVHVTDLDAKGLAETATALDVPAHPADLSDRSAAHQVVEAVVHTHGRLDGLALAAGGVRGQVGRPLEVINEEDWRAIFNANVDGAFWTIQAAAPHLKQSSAGRVITISSGAGLRPSLTGIQAYTSAKHALVGVTKQLSLELGAFGVTVNSIAPGFVLSNPATQRQWESYGPEGQARLVESIHLKRLGTPEDIAQAALFLASDAAAWISGQILSVDGGRS